MAAGTWFMVLESGKDWETLQQVWVSDGHKDCKGYSQAKLEIAEPDEHAFDAAALVEAGHEGH